MRNAVVWSGLSDISESRDQARRDGDRDRQLFVTLLAELSNRFPGGQSFTRGQVVKAAIKDESPEWSAVAEALTAMHATDATKLGYKVRKIKGRNFGNLRIVHYIFPDDDTARSRGGVRWMVEPCGTNTKAGGLGVSSPS